jgi:hypothetical protein
MVRHLGFSLRFPEVALVAKNGIRPPLTIGTFRGFIFCFVSRICCIGFVPLVDLLGNIGEELKIQKLPANVPGVISINFRSGSCRARQLSTTPATFAFLAVVLIPPHVVPSHLSPPRNSQRQWTTPLPPLPLFPDNFV